MTTEYLWWKLNDGSGTACSEEISSNTINLSAAPTWVSSGAPNGWYSYQSTDASNNYGVSVSNVGISSASVRSVSYWAKSNVSNVLNDAYVMNWGTSSNAFGNILKRDAPEPWCDWPGGAATSIGVNNTVGQWFHFVVIYDGTNMYTVYNTTTGNVNEIALNTSDGTMRLNIDPFSSKLGFSGDLSDIRVYTSVLTTEEIAWLYNSGSGQTTSLSTMPAGETDNAIFMGCNL